MQIQFRETDDGVEFSVKVSPGSRKNEFRGVINGALKISVTAAAEKGKANAAIIKLLSKELRISKSRIELISGSTSSLKTIRVVDVDLATLKEQINQLLVK